MRKKFSFILFLPVLLGLVGCSKQGMIQSPETVVSVSGTVNYPQHIALTSDAVLHVILSNVTSPDAPRAIAEQTIARPGRVPIQFKVNYDSSRINPEHTYSVQACIRSYDQVRFVSTRAHPVITKGHTDKVKVILEPGETRQQAKQAGAVGYFRKPVDDQALLDTIQWALTSCSSSKTEA